MASSTLLTNSAIPTFHFAVPASKSVLSQGFKKSHISRAPSFGISQPPSRISSYCPITRNKISSPVKTRELAISVYPGVYNTGLVSGLGWGPRALISVTDAGRFDDDRDMPNNSCWEATSELGKIQNRGFYTPVGVRGKKVRENENMELAGKL